MLEQQLQPERGGNNYPLNVFQWPGGILRMHPQHEHLLFYFISEVRVLSVHHPVNFKAITTTMTLAGDFVALESFSQTCLKKRDSEIRRWNFYCWCCSENVAVYYKCPF